MKTCIQIENGSFSVERLLQCSHEEADDRVMFHLNHAVMFHLNHAVKVTKYHSFVVASPDTEALVCAMHHFKQLTFFDLNEFRFLSGRSDSTAVPIHDLVDHMNADVVLISWH